MKAFTVSGARLKLLINGRTIGFVTGFNWNIDYGKKAIRGIDSPFPQEIAPGQQTLRGSIRCIRLKDIGDLEGYGIVAEQSPTNTSNINQTSNSATSRLSDVQIEKYINITMIDVGSEKVIFKADKATILSQSWGVTAKTIMEGSFDFEAFMKAPLT